MASSSGTSTGSSILNNSGSEEDLKQIMEQKKKKRMISNRESARRSRMKKQKHLDELMVQVTNFKKENSKLLTNMNVTTQHYLNVEAENSVLRAQVVELSHRLESLNQIITFLDPNCNGLHEETNYSFNIFAQNEFLDDGQNNSWNNVYANLPIIMTPDILQY